MFYPRVLAFDRLRGRYEQFGSAAAAAGCSRAPTSVLSGLVGHRRR